MAAAFEEVMARIGGMDLIIRIYVRAQNWHRGQKLAKFALIRPAVALVMYSMYQTAGAGVLPSRTLRPRRRLVADGTRLAT